MLGSSIDMGWGVGTDETYVNLLEDWLNAARRRSAGLARRFEVLNFAVAAYSPMQRLEAFRRKAAAFRARPGALLGDDARHPADRDPPLRHAPGPGSTCATTSSARRSPPPGITADDLRLDSEEQARRTRTAIKAKLRPHYWPIYDATLGALAADCRSAGVPLAAVIIPRVGKADAPDARAERGGAAPRRSPRTTRCRCSTCRATFDDLDPGQLEIAAWDDHPNALRPPAAVPRAWPAPWSSDQTLYQTLFQRAGSRPEAELECQADRLDRPRKTDVSLRHSSTKNATPMDGTPPQPAPARRAAARRPDHPAVEDEHGRTLTYADLGRAADRLATRLGRWGVGRGDRVGLFLPKGIEAVAAIHGVLRVGRGVRAGRPDRARRSRGAGIFADGGVKAVVVAAGLAAALRRRWPGPGPAAPPDRRRATAGGPRPDRRRLGRGPGRRRPSAPAPAARGRTTWRTSSTRRARPAGPRG